MFDVSELFWNATLDDMKRGFVYNDENEQYVCLICGVGFEEGIIYPRDGLFLEAKKYVRKHIEDEHTSMFDYLMGLDKKLTGLTDLQKQLIHSFQQGLSDAEIVKELEGGSTSTIRNHRFTLREKAKQAKVFLAIMELMVDKPGKQQLIPIHRTATVLDERFVITEEENALFLKTYFKEGPDGPLSEFPAKEKRKVAILRHLIKRFTINRRYTEKEVNAVLKAAFADYATLRRYLIEYGFMDREPDCSAYWVKV
ncbi:DUF2087 domain-containing protein [Paenibacillus contaminans]|uniref:Transcriptional regulator n=1 Tax=Paenibacillus contaminans TaxID=450362 RepID=A0A329MR33_9BACL|nr:DUF2087 domain-containing protein [Paenibacillus contaminans]RAV21992.1 transcriptional regulator [Paenibacillus contaminans]